ncbi:DUF4339 domain-containing protein, partial [Akkermansiaceae bacterium]|nr:DUF4339 domain-containing protein [Akkermansiaceae bacterium]
MLDSKYLVGKCFEVSEWHYISNEKQIGPVSLEELINKKNSGEIAPTDLVWSAGMADWLPIQEACPAMMNEVADVENSMWLYIVNDKQYGPVTFKEVLSLEDQRVITPNTYLWTEGMAEWIEF